LITIRHDRPKASYAYEYTLFTSSKNISEFLCATTRGDQPILSIADALRVVKHYRSILEVLYADHNSSVRLEELLQIHQARGLKIHDYEIAAIALANGISKIATFNAKDFTGISGLELIVA
jgi:predicted nucleic acid-binding protein